MIDTTIAASLRRAAKVAAHNAYAPYSKFHVGAAVYCSDGSIVSGCNVENASYGLTVCAERAAIFSAISQGLKPIHIAVTCPGVPDSCPDQNLRMPCGACRQVMAEFFGPSAMIIVDGVGIFNMDNLLPNAFKL